MIRFLTRGQIRFLLFFMMGIAFLGGCKNSEPNRNDLFKTNQKPVANAGPDQTVPSGATVTLDGSKSSDPNGKTFHYEWKMVSTPPGSGTKLDTPGSATTTFVADVDGVYRIQLLIVEDVDPTLPIGAPVADSGLTSDPDEVIVIAGPPGPFPDSGNKLMMDGKHFALSTTVLDIEDPADTGNKVTVADGTQLNEMTAEGWFFIGELPPQGPDALLMGKKDFFEIVLNPASQLFFRIKTRDGQTIEAGPATLSLNQWHHIAAVVAGKSQHRAYLAVDGVTVGAVDLAGLFNNNPNRFAIGGIEGRAFLVGMADEVRITQDVRYPETGFDPPKEILIPDSPFVSGARFAVHGLWHFDEPAGAKLFTDFSFRQNNLFLVGDTGFQPFGQLQTPRRFDSVVSLDDQSLWIAGGIDDAARAITETEAIGIDDQVRASAPLNLAPIKGELFGTGDGNTLTFLYQTIFKPILPQSITLVAGNIKGTDDGAGNLTGAGISSGTINYATGEISVTFATPPYDLHITNASLGTGDGALTSFSGTAFTPVKSKSVQIVADKIVAHDDGSGNLSGTGVQSGSVDYATGAMNITFTTAPNQGISVLASYDYNNQGIIPGSNTPILIDYTFDRGGGLFDHTATKLSDGRVLIAGGDDKNRQLVGLATLFDPAPAATQAIKLVGPMITPRRFHTAGLLSDGKVILVGGEKDSNNAVVTLSGTELFDPATLEFFEDSSIKLVEARKLHRMIFLRDCNKSLPTQDDRFLVVGGYDGNNQPLKTAEVYSNGGFARTFGSMSVGRVRHAVVCLPNGTILITGGIDINGLILDSAEVYDPATGLFTLLQAGMNTPRADHTATLMTNGKILIAGGFDQSGQGLNSAEIYDPDQKLFIPLSSTMGIGRLGHQAVPWKSAALGRDGVLLIGGGDAAGTPTSLLEIFYP